MKKGSFLLLAICCSASLTFADEFVPTGIMHTVRGDTVSVLLNNGTALVAGGWTTDGGGCPGRGTPTRTAETYDPITESFTLTGPMVMGRWEHSAIALDDGRILIAGGANGCVNNMTATAEVYDPSTRTFSAVSGMTITRKSFPMAKLPDGRVLVFGGTKEGNFATATTRVDIFDPATNSFSLAGYLAVDRGGHGVCALNDGKFLLMGGMNRFDDAASVARNKSAEIYDPLTNTSRLLPALMVNRHLNRTTAVRLDDGTCLISSQNMLQGGVTVEIFDPVTETFSAAPVQGTITGNTDNGSSNVLPDGRVLLSPNPAMLFDQNTNTLSVVDRISGMPYAGSTSVTLPNGEVLLAAGSSPQGTLNTQAYLFTPSAPSSPPVAVAGPDQSIRAGGAAVLNGDQSFDDSTTSLNLLYSWTLQSTPAGSQAVLSGADSVSPALNTDVAGTYEVALIVTDHDGLSSLADTLSVSTENLAPTADAGMDKLIVLGEAATFDGSGSLDPEQDLLMYNWFINSWPEGSNAELPSENAVTASFIPDVEGQYIVSLVVADYIGPGTSDSVVVNVISPLAYAELEIVNASDVLDTLTASAVTTAGNQNALSNFLLQAVLAIQEGDIEEAANKLNSALARTDGCILRQGPDANGPGRDWVTDCDEQEEIYDLLTSALRNL